VGWFGVRRTEATVPSPQTLLRAVYVGRICLAVAIYVTAAAKVAVAAPLQVLVVSFVLIAAILFTPGPTGGAISARSRRQRRSFTCRRFSTRR